MTMSYSSSTIQDFLVETETQPHQSCNLAGDNAYYSQQNLALMFPEYQSHLQGSEPQTLGSSSTYLSTQQNDPNEVPSQNETLNISKMPKFTSYDCVMCTKQFPSKEELKDHKKYTHMRKFTCGECSKEFTAKMNLILHIDKIHNNIKIKFPCTMCTKEFGSKQYLLTHVSTVHNKKFKCPKCPNEYISENFLMLHMNKNHILSQGKKFPCPTCFEEYATEKHLERHMKEHQLSFECSICFQQFTSKAHIRTHIYTRHKGMQQSFSATKKLATYTAKCSQCCASFRNEDFLKKHFLKCHQLSKSGTRWNTQGTRGITPPYQCSECSKYFKSKTAVQKHIELHHTSKKNPRSNGNNQTLQAFKCDKCNMSFRSDQFLQKHVCPNVSMANAEKSSNKINSIVKGAAVHMNVEVCLNDILLDHPEYYQSEDECEETNDNESDYNEEEREDGKGLMDIKEEVPYELNDNVEEHTDGVEEGNRNEECDQSDGQAIDEKVLIELNNTDHGETKPTMDENANASIKREIMDRDNAYIDSTIKSESCKKRRKKGARKRIGQRRVKRGRHPPKKILLDVFPNHLGLYPCPDCEDQYAVRDDLYEHFRSFHSGLVYPCPQCPRTFRSKYLVEEHLSTIHEGMVYCCSYDACGKTFKTKLGLSYHERRHKNLNRTFRCTKCRKVFRNSGMLRLHKNAEHGPDTYKCPQCAKLFTSSHGMRRHVSVIHDGIVFECDLCHKSFGDKVSLKRHLLTHSQPDTERGAQPGFKCKTCGATFNSERARQEHVMLKHEGTIYKCTECTKVFPEKKLFSTHLKYHASKVKPKYKCSYCQIEFGWERTLQEHIRKAHRVRTTALKRFYCKQCPKSFSQSHGLSGHIKSVHEGRLYECNICARPFTHKVSVNIHMKREHNMGIQCTVCDKVYMHHNSLISHMLSAHPDKPSDFQTCTFPCTQCDTTFVSVDKLLQHSEAVHFEYSLSRQVSQLTEDNE